MSIDPLDRPHDQQPVPGQQQNPAHTPDFITDNPDVQSEPGNTGRSSDRNTNVPAPETPVPPARQSGEQEQ